MKCADLVRTLDSRTLGKLKKYLLSPYLCPDESMAATLEALIESTDSTREGDPPDKESLFTRIFGKRKYDDSRLRLQMSRLFAHVERFLALEELDPFALRLGLARHYRSRSLHKFYQEAMQDFAKELEKSSLRNEHYYEQEYRMRLDQYEYLASIKRQGEFNLKEISDTLEISYIIKKLRHCCRVLHVQSVYKLENPFPFIDEIKAYIEHEKLYSIPVLGFYYYNYLAILHPAEDHYFRKCLEIYNESDSHFETEERREVFVNILNYCIRKINEGKEEYNETVFGLYMRGLDRGFLLDRGKLSRFTYRNIAEIGINLREYGWVDEFLDRYKSKLEKQYQQAFHHFEKGRLFSEQKKYHEAMSWLGQLSFNDPLLELSVRLERIRIFYEMGERELSEYHVDSMDQFLRRKKNFGYHTEYYKCFLKYMRKLLRINPMDNIRSQSLLRELELEPRITGRKWLTEKFQKILN